MVISDLLSYSHVTTWSAALHSARVCASVGTAVCDEGSERCEDLVVDDDGMAGLPDAEETLNVFLR